MARLLEVRKHAGMIVPGPVQAAVVAALDDDAHVREQRARYAARRAVLRPRWSGRASRSPRRGRLYLWSTRGEPALDSVARLADRGILVAPGTFYGPRGSGTCGSP